MMYRRLPRRRRYTASNTQPPKHFADVNKDVLEDTQKELENIPLPNEKEDSSAPPKNSARIRRPSFLNFFKKRFGADEIILIGLIFLLIEESAEDEFLLIILIYLLVSGID
ncbi:MAG: hypothetical protein ACOYWZ_03235 [Bacillota bacterium]